MPRLTDGKVLFGRVADPSIDDSFVLFGDLDASAADDAFVRRFGSDDGYVSDINDWFSPIRFSFPSHRASDRFGGTQRNPVFQVGDALHTSDIDQGIAWFRSARLVGRDTIDTDSQPSIQAAFAFVESNHERIIAGRRLYDMNTVSVGIRHRIDDDPVWPFSLTLWELEESFLAWAEVIGDQSTVSLVAAFSGAPDAVSIQLRVRVRYNPAVRRMTHALWDGQLLRVGGVEVFDRRRFMVVDLQG